MKKRFLAVILAAALMVSLFAVGTIHSAAASQYAQTSTPVEGGNMLHCMCWSYNTIKANLDDIKAAGYTAVQTSCIQPPKDYNVYDSTKGNVWWHFYQPVDFCVADGNNWLGTKAELTSLCETAHEKGIKIIADVVANHMANPGSHGSYNGRSGEINETLLKDESCWHNTGTALSGSDRYDMVMHDNSNLPDLNTSNSKVQSMVLGMLKEAIDCGVDGFRFDAAQNIETPRDNDAYKSMFWANTIGEANTYASSKGKTLFSYGEVYYDAWGGDNVLDDYIWYIGHVTEPNIGMEALGGVQGQDASRVAAVNYKNNRSASKNVLWVESHDSYYSGTGYGGTQTSSVGNTSVVRAWAIIASRADATALYFARPGSEYVTNATNDTTWKSTAVSEVNKFKNYFRGKSEYLATSGKVAYNERGTGGVVISKLDGSGSVSLTAHTIASGTYKDQITGNTFTVSNGTISGTVGSTGVAVVYNPSGSSTETIATTADGSLSRTYYLFGYINGANYACEDDYTNMGSYKFAAGSDGTLTATFTADSYVAVKQENNANWYMFQNYVSSGTESTLYNTGTGASEKMKVPANKKVTFTLKENTNGTLSLSYADYVEPTSASTEAPDTETPATQVVTSAPDTETPETSAPGSGYFLVGSFNSWTESSAYEFTLKDSSTNEYKLLGVTLHKNDEFKAKKGSTWYPSGTGNNFVVSQDGTYNVYFRPNGNGNSDWTSPYFYLSRKGDITEAPTEAPTAAPVTSAPETEPQTDAPETEAPETEAPETYLIGDADNDGEISVLDATAIQKQLAMLIDLDRLEIRGKVLLDNDILNITDATVIQKYLALLEVSNTREIGSIAQY
ncbi:MAG: hypothetical protein IJH32_04785 [Ruminococcus sp.]|nr:hypothetical protein [Ruminococcus sp.]